MTAVTEMKKHTSLNRALYLSGLSKTAWYYTKTKRNIPLSSSITNMVQDIAQDRPTYGTRRMAAMISREYGVTVNRKQMQRIYRKLGWIEPKKSKNEIIASSRKPFRPTAPNQLWQTDMTYIWCGIDGWCYCFNVIDVFTRQWLSYIFDTTASKDAAIDSIVNAVSTAKPDCRNLIIQSDNGVQFRSEKFRKTITLLKARQSFIWNHTPEQNGHVESFHKTLKKEYIWPHDFQNYSQAQPVIEKAFQDYNNSRIHSALGYVTPNEFEAQWRMRNK